MQASLLHISDYSKSLFGCFIYISNLKSNLFWNWIFRALPLTHRPCLLCSSLSQVRVISVLRCFREHPHESCLEILFLYIEHIMYQKLQLTSSKYIQSTLLLATSSGHLRTKLWGCSDLTSESHLTAPNLTILFLASDHSCLWSMNQTVFLCSKCSTGSPSPWSGSQWPIGPVWSDCSFSCGWCPPCPPFPLLPLHCSSWYSWPWI